MFVVIDGYDEGDEDVVIVDISKICCFYIGERRTIIKPSCGSEIYTDHKPRDILKMINEQELEQTIYKTIAAA